jgi:hypothetical protein
MAKHHLFAHHSGGKGRREAVADRAHEAERHANEVLPAGDLVERGDKHSHDLQSRSSPGKCFGGTYTCVGMHGSLQVIGHKKISCEAGGAEPGMCESSLPDTKGGRQGQRIVPLQHPSTAQCDVSRAWSSKGWPRTSMSRASVSFKPGALPSPRTAIRHETTGTVDLGGKPRGGLVHRGASGAWGCAWVIGRMGAGALAEGPVPLGERDGVWWRVWGAGSAAHGCRQASPARRAVWAAAALGAAGRMRRAGPT